MTERPLVLPLVDAREGEYLGGDPDAMRVTV
jgi:hypothetical protein